MLALDKIIVGERHRKAMGDVGGLAASMAEIGLLHPVVVTSDHKLIVGRRRMLAAEQLGWTEVPVRVIDIAGIMRGERDENTKRKDFVPSEAVDVWAACIDWEKGEAAKRMEAGDNQHTEGCGKFPQGSKGRARDKAAAGVGYSDRSLRKAAEICDAAWEDPKKFGKLKADMDHTGNVDGPHKRLVVMRKAAAIADEPPALPGKGPYRVIVVDPPWPYELRKADPTHRATHPYPQMSIEAIMALDVASIAHDDCILWLWTTNHHMHEAFHVLEAWGFRHKTILTWVKDRMGTGDWLRGRSEHALMAVRGKPIVTLTNQTTAFDGPLRENSRKPDEFYAVVESLCPGSRAELFQREARTGWDGHGDEVADGG